MEKIIIISNDPNLSGRLKNVIQAEGYHIAGECREGLEAVRMVRRVSPDLLLIEDELSGLRGFDIASIFIEEESIPVLLIAGEIDGAVLSKAKKSPYFSVMKDAGDNDALLINIRLLLNISVKIRNLKNELIKKEKESLLIKNLNLAKGILMAKDGMSEKDAHRYLQRESMKKGVSLEKIIAEIVKDHI